MRIDLSGVGHDDSQGGGMPVLKRSPRLLIVNEPKKRGKPPVPPSNAALTDHRIPRKAGVPTQASIAAASAASAAAAAAAATAAGHLVPDPAGPGDITSRRRASRVSYSHAGSIANSVAPSRNGSMFGGSMYADPANLSEASMFIDSAAARARSGGRGGPGSVISASPSGFTKGQNSETPTRRMTKKELLEMQAQERARTYDPHTLVAALAGTLSSPIQPSFSPQVWCIETLRVLSGDTWQQRVWTVGNPSRTPVNAAAVAKRAGNHLVSGQSTARSMGSDANGFACAIGGPAPDALEQAAAGAVAVGEELEEGESDYLYTSASPLSLLDGVQFNHISAGHHHSAAITGADQFVYIWGSNQLGQLGLGTPTAQLVAQHPFACEKPPLMQLPHLPEALGRALNIGLSRSFNRTHSGRSVRRSPAARRAATSPSFTQIPAHGDEEEEEDEEDSFDPHLPAHITPGVGDGHDMPSGVRLSSLWHELNPADVPQMHLRLYRLPLGAPIGLVACGAHHTLAAFKTGGGVVGWGDNQRGQVGVHLSPGREVIEMPTRLPELAGAVVTALAAGDAHSGAVVAGGHLWMWGDGSDGQLGLVGVSTYSHPQRVQVQGTSKQHPFTSLALGPSHSLALTSKGVVYACGSNKQCQLGTSDTSIQQDTFTIIDRLPPCSSVAAGVVSAAISTAGELFVWGWHKNLNPEPATAAATLDAASTDSGAVQPSPAPDAADGLVLEASLADLAHASGVTDVQASAPVPASEVQSSALDHSSAADAPVTVTCPPPTVSVPEHPVIRRVTWLGLHKFRAVALGVHHAVATSVNGGLYQWGHRSCMSAEQLSTAFQLWEEPPSMEDFLLSMQAAVPASISFVPPGPSLQLQEQPPAMSCEVGKSAAVKFADMMQAVPLDGGGVAAAVAFEEYRRNKNSEGALAAAAAAVPQPPLPPEPSLLEPLIELPASTSQPQIVAAKPPANAGAEVHAASTLSEAVYDAAALSATASTSSSRCSTPRTAAPTVCFTAYRLFATEDPPDLAEDSGPSQRVRVRITCLSSSVRCVLLVEQVTHAPVQDVHDRQLAGRAGGGGGAKLLSLPAIPGSTFRDRDDEEASPVLSLEEEPALRVVCGACHTLILTSRTKHTVTHDELYQTVLLLLWQYAQQWNEAMLNNIASGFGWAGEPQAPSAAAAVAAAQPASPMFQWPPPHVGNRYASVLPPLLPLNSSPEAGRLTSRSVRGGARQKGMVSGFGRQSMSGGGGLGGNSMGMLPGEWDTMPDRLSLEMVLLLCRQVGLVDNITEYVTVVRAFKAALQSKHGREPPSGPNAAAHGSTQKPSPHPLTTPLSSRGISRGSPERDSSPTPALSHRKHSASPTLHASADASIRVTLATADILSRPPGSIITLPPLAHHSNAPSPPPPGSMHQGAGSPNRMGRHGSPQRARTPRGARSPRNVDVAVPRVVRSLSPMLPTPAVQYPAACASPQPSSSQVPAFAPNVMPANIAAHALLHGASFETHRNASPVRFGISSNNGGHIVTLASLDHLPSGPHPLATTSHGGAMTNRSMVSYAGGGGAGALTSRSMAGSQHHVTHTLHGNGPPSEAGNARSRAGSALGYSDSLYDAPHGDSRQRSSSRQRSASRARLGSVDTYFTDDVDPTLLEAVQPASMLLVDESLLHEHGLGPDGTFHLGGTSHSSPVLSRSTLIAAAAAHAGGRKARGTSASSRGRKSPSTSGTRALVPAPVMRQQLHGNDWLDSTDVLTMMLVLMKDRMPSRGPQGREAELALLARSHITRLHELTVQRGVPWPVARIVQSDILRMFEASPANLMLHQVYSYLTSADGLTADLGLGLGDVRRGLAQTDAPFSVPLLRLAQWLRQVGLMPKVLTRHITQLEEDVVTLMEFVPLADHPPWWWPSRPGAQSTGRRGTHSRALAGAPSGGSSVRLGLVPARVNLVGLETISGVVSDMDILDIAGPKCRKHVAALTSEEHLDLQHLKRDRLLCYVLAHLMGGYLVDVQTPWDMRPEVVLKAPITYPQFLEVIAVLAAVKASSQTPAGGLLQDPSLDVGQEVIAAHIPQLMQLVTQWREQVLLAWKFTSKKHTDHELEQQVDRAFSLYCIIDPLADTLGVNGYQYTRFMQDTGLIDEHANIPRAHALLKGVASGRLVVHEMRRMEGVQKAEGEESDGGQNSVQRRVALADDMEWTGLTAKQIAHLHASQFAHSVVQSKLNSLTPANEEPPTVDQALAAAAARPALPFALSESANRHRLQAGNCALWADELPEDDWRHASQDQKLAVDPAGISKGRAGVRRKNTSSEGGGRRPVRRSSSYSKLTASGGGKSGSCTSSAAPSRSPSPPRQRFIADAVDWQAGGMEKQRFPTPSASQLNAGEGLAAWDDSDEEDVVRPWPRQQVSRHLSRREKVVILAEQEGAQPAHESAPTLSLSDIVLAELLAPMHLTSTPTANPHNVRPPHDSSAGSVWQTGPPYAAVTTGKAAAARVHAAPQIPQDVYDPRAAAETAAAVAEIQRVLQEAAGPQPAFRQGTRTTLALTASQDAIRGILTPATTATANQDTHGVQAEGAPPLQRESSQPGPEDSLGTWLSPEPSNLSNCDSDASSPPRMAGGISAAAGGKRNSTTDSAPGAHSHKAPRRVTTFSSLVTSVEAIAHSLSETRPTEEADELASPINEALPPTPAPWGDSDQSNAVVQPPSSKHSMRGEAVAQSASPTASRNKATRKSKNSGLSAPAPTNSAAAAAPAAARSTANSAVASEKSAAVDSMSVHGGAKPAHTTSRSTSQAGSGRSSRSPSRSGSARPARARHGRAQHDSSDSETDEGPGPKVSVKSALVMTREDLEGPEEDDEAMFKGRVGDILLSRAQFGECIRRFAVMKYNKISSPLAAWRLVIERHILPLVEALSTKFDKYLEALMSPTVISMVLEWEARLKKVFQVYGKQVLVDHSAFVARPVSGTARPHTTLLENPRWNGSLNPISKLHVKGSKHSEDHASHARHAHDSPLAEPLEGAEGGMRLQGTMSFLQLLQLCQDRKVIPQMILPAGLEEIFRRVNFMDGFHENIQDMGYPQFVDAVCLTALTVFSQKRYADQKAGIETQLESFFARICDVALPRSGGYSQIGGRGFELPEDAFKEWWALSFEEGSEEGQGGARARGAWSHLSSNAYNLVLLQELVLPPLDVPPAVVDILSHAAILHNEGRHAMALQMYDAAAGVWRALAAKDALGFELSLTPEQHIYLAVASASVESSCGLYDNALRRFEGVESDLAKLPATHPCVPLLHSCRACALYHAGSVQHAFEELVQAKVCREASPELGPRHVDTALLLHNLGCVLDALGKTHKAVEQLSTALSIFRSILGNTHPRTQVAGRNLKCVMHKCMTLEAKYRMTSNAAAAAQPLTMAAAAAAKLRGTSAGTHGLTVQPAGTGGMAATAMSSPSARLAAFRSRTENAFPKKSDLDYLGGGVHAAAPDVLKVYERIKDDIAQHARGGIHTDIPDGTFIMQHSSSTAAAKSDIDSATFTSHSAFTKLAPHGRLQTLKVLKGGVKDSTVDAAKDPNAWRPSVSKRQQQVMLNSIIKKDREGGDVPAHAYLPQRRDRGKPDDQAEKTSRTWDRLADVLNGRMSLH